MKQFHFAHTTANETGDNAQPRGSSPRSLTVLCKVRNSGYEGVSARKTIEDRYFSYCNFKASTSKITRNNNEYKKQG